MMLGIVILAMLAGAGAGVTLLFMGASIWLALAVYSGTGVVLMLSIFGAMAAASAIKRPDVHKDAVIFGHRSVQNSRP